TACSPFRACASSLAALTGNQVGLFKAQPGRPKVPSASRPPRASSASRNGHNSAWHYLRPCQGQKNLEDGEGQLAVEVVFSNPEPTLTILHRCKDISRSRCTRMDDYHRSLLQPNVTHGRMGQMPCDIVRRNIDLKAQLS